MQCNKQYIATKDRKRFNAAKNVGPQLGSRIRPTLVGMNGPGVRIHKNAITMIPSISTTNPKACTRLIDLRPFRVIEENVINSRNCNSTCYVEIFTSIFDNVPIVIVQSLGCSLTHSSV